MTVDLDSLRLVEYPAPVLRRKADPVERVNAEVRAVAVRMIEIMKAEEGIGLAAPQVGLPWRIFVSHVPPDAQRDAEGPLPTATKAPTVYINPKLTLSGPVESGEEGCLSLPEIRGEVIRPTVVTIEALDAEGVPFTASATGLLARCWQHEYDHLDGVLIIDKMRQIDRLKNRLKIKDLEHHA
ncbi:MAG: peptide deformylase [Phycisphaeraceae bacterium]|nr:MAG: peptide deformylase [Phycisphaeraceae bacterium]